MTQVFSNMTRNQQRAHLSPVARHWRKSQPALPTFIAKKAAIDALLAKLAAASADHFGAEPEAINWAHVGSLVEVEAKLAQIAEFLNI